MFLFCFCLGIQITIGIGNEVRDSTIQLTQMVCSHFPLSLGIRVYDGAWSRHRTHMQTNITACNVNDFRLTDKLLFFPFSGGAERRLFGNVRHSLWHVPAHEQYGSASRVSLAVVHHLPHLRLLVFHHRMVVPTVACHVLHYTYV